MNGDDRDPKRTWLNQHDSLQEELQRLKEEMRADRKVEPPPPEPEAKPPIIVQDEEPPSKDGPDDVAKTVELTVKDMLGPQETPGTTDEDLGPRKHEQGGAIPKHPELTSYIAKVMQHESRIKRKKFERDKVTKPREEAPPRIEPLRIEDEVPKTAADPIVNEVPQEDRPQDEAHTEPSKALEGSLDIEGTIIEQPESDGVIDDEAQEISTDVMQEPREDPPTKKANYIKDVRDDKADVRPPEGKGFFVRIRKLLRKRV